MKPLALDEKEYRLSLLRTERRAIVPIKWFTLAVTFVLWLALVRDRTGAAGDLPFVYMMFGGYLALTLAETVLFLTGTLGLARIKQVTLISYLADVVFVTTLIFFEGPTRFSGGAGPIDFSLQANFSILYFLLVMRGFALFKTVLETILVNALISVLFILTVRVQWGGFDFVTQPEFAIQLVLIWLVVLMAWFIMVVINQQKLDLIRANEQLNRAESLAKIGELAAGVAHEINNPLGVIIATAEYLKKTAPENDPRAEDIEAIYRESNRCKHIVHQMLDFAKPRPAIVAPQDAVLLNDEVLHFVFPKGRTAEIEVVKEYAEHPPPFEADADAIKQALLNLYLNARQAIPEGEKGRIISRIFAARGRTRVVFEIEDSGEGVDPADLEHVFDPFFTRKEQGSGLGLAVTQRIVEAAGGSIALDPVEPHGCRLRLEFPALPG